MRYDYRNIVGRTPRMLELFRLLDRVTDTALPVVIHGESGTGKELVARAIHDNGPRRDRPFVSENCAAIPETLLETDAVRPRARRVHRRRRATRRGLFEVADGGTLFLDEVGEMSPGDAGQAAARPAGRASSAASAASSTRKVDVRVLAGDEPRSRRAWSRRASSARICSSG